MLLRVHLPDSTAASQGHHAPRTHAQLHVHKWRWEANPLVQISGNIFYIILHKKPARSVHFCSFRAALWACGADGHEIHRPSYNGSADVLLRDTLIALVVLTFSNTSKTEDQQALPRLHPHFFFSEAFVFVAWECAWERTDPPPAFYSE